MYKYPQFRDLRVCSLKKNFFKLVRYRKSHSRCEQFNNFMPSVQINASRIYGNFPAHLRYPDATFTLPAFLFKQPNYGAKSVPVRDNGFLVQVGQLARICFRKIGGRASCLLIILSRLYYALSSCSQTIEFAEQRIPVLNEYCVVCDEPHVFQNGPMLRVS